jgi:hypothetical protein
MSWLARLKTGKTHDKDASKTTETLFVVSVAPTLAPFQKIDGATVAANDRIPTPTTARVDNGTVRPPGMSPLLLAASLALDASIVAAGTSSDLDPDAFSWPHSAAINGAEIDLFTARQHQFADKGLTDIDGEALADKLVLRDRGVDDRRSCLECRHLSGYGQSSWRCGNWQAAGIAIRSRDSQLPSDLVLQLQRCDGFATATPNVKASATLNSITKTSF